MSRPIKIPFPVTSAKDVPARAGVGRMVNVLMEQMPDGQVNYKRAPGIAPFSQSASGAVHCRGMISVNDGELIVVYNGFAELVVAGGNSIPLGPLIGTAIVSLARNNISSPDIVCVGSNTTYLLSVGSAPAPYPDSNIGVPNSVCYGDGYFFFTYGNGVCQASGLYATTINLLDQITVNSSPTTLLRGVYYAQTLFLFTEATIEAWTDTANPAGFPFSRAAVIPRGLISANAVAGFESNFTATLIFVGNDNIVYLMQGYAPVRISTSDQERRISNVSDKTTLRACVYVSEGHAIWQLTSSDFTLTYDITNSVWQERLSEGMNFSRIECGCFAFGGWIVGDYATGKLGQISANTFTEYGGALIYDFYSLPCANFPMRQIVKRADFNFVPGTGLPPSDDDYTLVTQGAVSDTTIDNMANPTVRVSWSDDGGNRFTMPLERKLGKIGRGYQVISVLRSGQTSRYGRVWRLTVSDPVYVGLISGYMESI
jgi:hypothetical protein